MRRILTVVGLMILPVLIFLFLNKTKIITLSIDDIANTIASIKKISDIEPQKPLANPPPFIKAIYATSWSAGSEGKLKYLMKLIKETELNAIVIDIKDFSGHVAYNTDLALPKKYNAVQARIPRLNALLKRLHDENIYIIARISVFQDQQFANARPDLALMSSSTQAVWKDYKGLAWLDPTAQDVWDYNIAIAEEALARGVDEVNFDYIRFASDGNLDDIRYPFWDEKKLKTHVLRDFFSYLRAALPNAKLSADLFGLVTINTDGLGVGQHLEYALPYFDYVAPMTYPSHYFKGFIGYQKPAEAPYEIVKYSMETALQRTKKYKAALTAKQLQAAQLAQVATPTPPVIAKLRPWFQDFDLGADYDANKVRAQIQAWYDVATTAPNIYDGWMLWNASNIYTKDALLPE